MENEEEAVRNQKNDSIADETKSKPPPGPTSWKPNTGRKRKRPTHKVIPSKDTQDTAIGSKKNSWVWDHFKRFEENGNPRAACNYCGQDYAAHPKLHGTGNMINHLNFQCKKYPYRKIDGKQKTLTFGKQGGDCSSSFSLKAVSYSYEECRTSLVEMVIIDELPFRIVEGEGFKKFVTSLQPKFTPPSRFTVARDCIKLYFNEKKKLKKLLKSQRICLTTDTWTSIQNINYMCVTAHWIDDSWKLQKRILSFCVIPNHKGKTIGKMVESCLLDWGIDHLLTITVDNASSNDSAINHLKKNTKGWKTTLFDHEFLHLRCCAHILNLIVKDGLKQQNESVLKIRNAVRYVRSSPARLEAFRTCAEIEKIESKSLVCLDIETRWNSTYLMLEAAIKFEKAFERLKEEDLSYRTYFAFGDKDDDEGNGDQIYEDDELNESHERGGKGKDSKYIGPPTENDWDVARSFVKFLKLFYDVTLQFSGSLHVTSNPCLQELVAVHTRLKALSKHSDFKVCLMASKMQSKFLKYWKNLDKMNHLLYVATVLDPRYKLKFVRFCFNQVYNDAIRTSAMEEEVRKVVVRLYEFYQNCNPCQSSENLSPRSNQNVANVGMDENLETGQSLAFQFAKELEEDECETKSEFAKYLEEKCEKDVLKVDILRWWKDNATRFPVLSQLARDVLAIPVSTVSFESAFSTSGRILDPYRSSLNPKMVEALVCCQNWLRQDSSTIDIQESMKEVPFPEVEKYEDIIQEFHSGASSSKSQVTIE